MLAHPPFITCALALQNRYSTSDASWIGGIPFMRLSLGLGGPNIPLRPADPPRGSIDTGASQTVRTKRKKKLPNGAFPFLESSMHIVSQQWLCFGCPTRLLRLPVCCNQVHEFTETFGVYPSTLVTVIPQIPHPAQTAIKAFLRSPMASGIIPAAPCVPTSPPPAAPATPACICLRARVAPFFLESASVYIS